MAATSLFRELNKRGTIAHNVANLLCGYLIFYNQVRYTAGKVTKNICHFLTKNSVLVKAYRSTLQTAYKVYPLYNNLYILM